MYTLDPKPAEMAYMGFNGIAEFDENSGDKKPTVQVGDPFIEKLLMGLLGINER